MINIGKFKARNQHKDEDVKDMDLYLLNGMLGFYLKEDEYMTFVRLEQLEYLGYDLVPYSLELKDEFREVL